TAGRRWTKRCAASSARPRPRPPRTTPTSCPSTPAASTTATPTSSWPTSRAPTRPRGGGATGCRRPPPPSPCCRRFPTPAPAPHPPHGHGLPRRGAKPENLLIDPPGRPRATDFGIARRLDRAAGLPAAGQVLGPPGYMAPEQALGRHEDVCPATDVYSLGGILYFLLTGRPPFQGRTITDTLCQVATTPPTPPREVNPQAPAALEAVALKCLEKEPVTRAPNARASLGGPGAACAGDGPGSPPDTGLLTAPAAAPAPPSPAPPAWAAAAAARAPGKWRARRTDWLGPAAALLVGLGVGA